MISPELIYWAFSAIYEVVTVGLVVWLQRLPDRYHRYCYPVLFVVAISGVAVVIEAAEIGVFMLNGAELVVSRILGDLNAYPVLWGVTAMLAGVSRRLFAIAVVIPFLQRVAFTVANISEGPVALLALLALVGGYGYLVYLYRSRIWEVAQSVSAKRRLLHWKARNLLLFLIGMIIVWSVLYIFGLFDRVVSAVLIQYMNLLIRAGFAGFLFANVTNIDVSDAAGGLLDELGGSGGQPADPDPAD